MENHGISSALRDKLRTKLNKEELETVLSAVNEVFANYDVIPKAPKSTGPDPMPETFLQAMSAGGRTPKTIEQYRYVINKFLKAANENTQNITADHIRQFLAEERERGIARQTLNGYRDVLSAYYGWLRQAGKINKNPVIEVELVKCPKKIKQGFTEVEIEKLKLACRTYRESAVVYFLLSTGCSVSEMTELNRDSADLENHKCVILGKGNRERAIPLDPVAVMKLREFLDDRIDVNPALFINKQIERMKPANVRSLLEKIGKRTGVENVHPSRFRATIAIKLLRREMPLQKIAAFLGLKKLDSVLKYDETDEENVSNAYRRFT